MNNRVKNHNSEFVVLNQLIAAQSMLHVFYEETKLCEFIVHSLIDIPAIMGCAICLRDSTIVKGIPELEVATIMEFLKNIPEEQEHFQISLPEKENRHVFSMETMGRSFGYVYISLKTSGGFDIFKPAISNYINMIAMDMENRWQKKQLINSKLHLEKLVEKRTAELKTEIDERKHAEGKLQKSELHYRTLFNESPIPMWEENFSEVKKYIDKLKEQKVKDLDKYFQDKPEELVKISGLIKIIDVNNACIRLHEANSKEELLKGLDLVFTKDSFIAFKEELIAIAHGKTKYDFEGVVKTLKGNLRNIHLAWRVLPGYENSFEKIYISTIDITEDKLAKEVIIKNQYYLSKAQEIGNIGTWELNIQNGILKWTDETYKIFGIPLGTKMSYELFFNSVHPDDRDYLTEKWNAGLNKEPYDIEHRIIVKSKVKWLREKADFEFDVEGNPVMAIGFVQDITVQKEMYKTVIEEKNKAQQYLNIAEVIMVSTDSSGIVKLINPKGCEILGYSEEEIVGNNWFDNFLPERLRENVKEVSKKVYAGEMESVKYYENKILTKAGDERLIAWRNAVYKDDNGRIIGALSSGEDITDRKATELKLQKSEDRLSKALIASNDGMWDWNLITNDTYFDPRYFKMAGYDIDEFPHNLKEYQERTHPDDIDNVMKNVQLHLDGETQQYNVEFRFKKKNGDWLWLLGRGKIVEFDKNKKPIRFIGTHTDITERKLMQTELRKSENKFRLLANYTFDWEYWIDTNGDYVYISPSCERTTGYTAEEFISKPYILFEMVHPDFREMIQTHYQNENNKNGPIYTTLFPIINRSGDKVWIEHNCSPIFDEEGNYLGRRGNNRDITVRKKAEEDLIKALEKATESDRLKTAFLTNMSHEIRTPMNGILGFSGLLKEPGLSGEKQKEYIKVIEKSGDRMLTTINDIIDISRIESGQVDITISEVNINKRLENLHLFFKPEANKKGIQLNFKSGLPKQEAIVKSDKGKINSILTNLIKNAIKYTHDGSIELGYNLKTDGGIFELEFYIKDTGIGIPKERQEAIFGRFIQADIEDKNVYEGSGLGLAISKAYVEMIGGKIWLESEEGVGSQFYFTIPYNTNKKKISKSEDTESKIKSDLQINKLKILIVEDEEVAMLYLTIVLEDFGKEFIFAKTGIEAIEACRNNPDIDLILMDIRLPDMYGYEATQKIREFNKDVVIIAQTAFGLTRDKEKALEAGCNDYISKPISKDLLIEMIQQYFS